jgi:hypothetical protein
MALFKDIVGIKNYVNIPEEMDLDRLIPLMEPSAKKHLKPVLGNDLLVTLDDYYNDDEALTNAAYDSLIQMVQTALANFIFVDGIHLLDVVITSTGIGVVHNQNVAPASKERVAALKQSMEELAYDAIEELYAFLEDNSEDYALWTSSDAYSKHYDLFIHSALQFDNYVNIRKKRRKYLDMVPAMKRVEIFEIIPNISQDLATTIKDEIKDGTISENNLKALDLICGAIANLTMAETIHVDVSNVPAYTQQAMISNADKEKEDFKRAGVKYLAELRRFLDENADDYPDYKASDIYDEDLENYEKFENDTDDSIFVMGG